jgi:glycosyltransferase involved in cell wall biosynthesis
MLIFSGKRRRSDGVLANSSFLCKVKVVILHQHFNTPEKGGALRSYYLARALVGKGVDVTVITAHQAPHYRQAKVEGIDVHYLPVPYNNAFGFFRRIQSFIRFACKSAALAAKFREARICYAISTPLTVGWTAMHISRRYGIPYLFEVGDLWPDAPIQLNVIRNGLLRRLLYGFEKTIYKRAELVVALSTSIQSSIKTKVPGVKTIVIPNMADCEFYRPEAKASALEGKFNVRGKFVVSYIGAVGYANGLDYFLSCAAACRQEPGIRFLICGDGAELTMLKEKARQSNITNLSFIPQQNRAGVREVLCVTDAVFVCYRPVPILQTGSPNKYFDGLAAGKLIVINFGGWIKAEIEEHRHGLCLDPDKPETFMEAIRPFVVDPSRLVVAQRAARDLGEQRYSRTILSNTFTKLFVD